jgi:hypothetical protein
MFDVFCLSVALAVGQGGPADQPQAGRATVGETPVRTPASLPTMTLPSASPAPRAMPIYTVSQGAPVATPAATAPAAAAPAVTAAPAAGCTTCEEKKEEEKKEEEPGCFMKMLEGTHAGSVLKDNGIKISGWAAGSYNWSQAGKSNLPVVWNDRANRFLGQQLWLDVSKDIDTESKEFHTGFKVAFLAGSDYRYTTLRGLFDRQMKNYREDPSEPNGYTQNIYGVDLPLFYASFWLPNLFEGTEVQVGRVFTPWGVESVMAPSTPLMSRSYAFNWSPPFFHVGVSVNPKFSKNWSGKFIAANGNDVWFDGSEEWRAVAAMTYTSDDENDTLTFATSLGRGKFNPNKPTVGHTTIALDFEPAGRNNLNAFDLVWTHKINDDLSYAAEGIFGYQYNVPASATGNADNFGGNNGTATWWSVAQYLTYNFTEKTSSVLRFEVFGDTQGQRTGYEGIFYAATYGVQFRPTDSIIIRPEIRYDYNGYTKAFDEGTRSGLLTIGSDLIFKF